MKQQQTLTVQSSYDRVAQEYAKRIFWIDHKLHGLNFRQSEQSCLSEPMSTIHQLAICRQNDRIG